MHKNMHFTFCIKTYLFVISANIQPVNLPLPTDPTFVGVTATVSGWGRTAQCKCIATFNLQSKIKDWLLYSWCQLDLIEVAQDYVI
jgi:hypothetical protein